MERRRLLLAGEQAEGRVPPSFLVAAALHQKGYRLRLFLVGTDPHLSVLLQRLCEQEVTLLDPWLCGTTKNLRALFQAASDESALNLILAPLAPGRLEEGKVRLHPSTVEVARQIGGALVPLIYGDGSSMVTAHLAQDVLREMKRLDMGEPAALVFSSLPNLREYQLLELEMGRRMPSLGLGFVPRYLERALPPMEDLLDDELWRQATLSLRAAAAQLESLSGQIGWPFFSALGAFYGSWEPSPFPLDPLLARPLVSLLRPQGVDVAGNNIRLFLEGLDCRLVEASLAEGRVADRADAVIVLPGAATKILLALASNGALRSQLSLALLGRRPLLVMGTALPPLGRRILLGESSVRGLDFFPFETRLEGAPGVEGLFETGIASKTDDAFLRGRERLRGWLPKGFQIQDAFDIADDVWNLFDDKGSPQPRCGGWSSGPSVVTPLVFEFWSQPAVFRRWLS